MSGELCVKLARRWKPSTLAFLPPPGFSVPPMLRIRWIAVAPRLDAGQRLIADRDNQGKRT
jgi:hypothetical protein